MAVRGPKYLWAFVALAIATSAASVPVGAEPPKRFQSETPAPRVDYWQKREAEIVAEIAGTKDLSAVKLVFIGDSITDFWHLDENPWFKGKWMGRPIWDESFGETATKNRAINMGISGDRIEHVLYRLTPASAGGLGMLDRADLQPEFMVIMLGINNTFDGEDPLADSLLRGVKAAIDTAHDAKPGAKIILQSILPTDDPVKNEQVVIAVNKRLAELARQPGYASLVTYLDLYTGFVDANGAQRKELFVDGLHPARDGYRVWRDRLVAALEKARIKR
jgi:lysophospholipase L1-like esterase